MDLYHIALFLHLLTLIAATVATAITKLAAGRRDRAATVGEMLEWHRVLTSTAAVFPACLALFTATGAYMLYVAHMNAWRSGFVVAGLVGVVLLFASGTVLGIKGKGLRQHLETMAAGDPNRPAPQLSPSLLLAALPMINTGVAIAVVYDMTMKPATVSVALGVIALGIVVGAIPALRQLKARGAEPATETPS